ncbi:disulfide bond formation protein DsbB [Bacillus sp. 491mf]|uniref:disulfide bond formation protein B n=1 Tax=Bacillus TaxID=1386 RepID=UPI0005536A29|nr:MULTISPECIES: disulfide bond formation protein B [unclassified Bacillus (in: firmicutes)]SFD26962.1 disulfide bond formation protein DsbB [Bacillus sp. 491mf]
MLRLAFIVSSLATIGSLYFSEIKELPPCDLCWYQRIFMYSIPLLIGISKWKKHKDITIYIKVFSGIGLAFALYQVILQTWQIKNPACGIETNCSNIDVQYFGFLTIPMMSLFAFLIIFLCAFFIEKKKYSFSL